MNGKGSKRRQVLPPEKMNKRFDLINWKIRWEPKLDENPPKTPVSKGILPEKTPI